MLMPAPAANFACLRYLVLFRTERGEIKMPLTLKSFPALTKRKVFRSRNLFFLVRELKNVDALKNSNVRMIVRL